MEPRNERRKLPLSPLPLELLLEKERERPPKTKARKTAKTKQQMQGNTKQETAERKLGMASQGNEEILRQEALGRDRDGILQSSQSSREELAGEWGQRTG